MIRSIEDRHTDALTTISAWRRTEHVEPRLIISVTCFVNEVFNRPLLATNFNKMQYYSFHDSTHKRCAFYLEHWKVIVEETVHGIVILAATPEMGFSQAEAWQLSYDASDYSSVLDGLENCCDGTHNGRTGRIYVYRQ